jgi:hypothetical protein
MRTRVWRSLLLGAAILVVAATPCAAAGDQEEADASWAKAAIRLREAIETLQREPEQRPAFSPLYVPRSAIRRDGKAGSPGPAPTLRRSPPPAGFWEDPDRLQELWANRPKPEKLHAEISAALAAPDERPAGPPGMAPSGPALVPGLMAKTLGPDAWTPLFGSETYGSTHYAGRATQISRAYDPAQGIVTSWAGTVGGGLYKVVVVGFFAFWVPVSQTLPGSPSVGSFLVRPSNGNQILIGTGDYYRYLGDGIYRSLDGGSTWVRTPAPLSSSTFRLRESWADDAVVFAATEGRLLRSTDFGGTWSTVMSGVNPTDVVQDPVTPNHWYVALGGTGVYESSDNGLSFHPFGGGCVGLPGVVNRTELAISASAPNYVYAVAANGGVLNGIYRSNDYGCHWASIDTQDTISWGQAFHAMAIAVDPTTPDRLFVGAGAAQWTSNATAASPCWVRNLGFTSDCGIPYTIAPGHPDLTDFLLYGNHLYVSNDGGLFDYNWSSHTSADLGNNAGFNSWQSLAAQTTLAASLFDPTFLVTGMQDNGVAKIQGALATAVDGGDGGEVSISPDDTDHFYYTLGVPFGRWGTDDSGASHTYLDCSLGAPFGGVMRDPTPGLGPAIANLYTLGLDGAGSMFLYAENESSFPLCGWAKAHATALPSSMTDVDLANDISRRTLYVSGPSDRRVFVSDSQPPGAFVWADRTPPTIDSPLTGAGASALLFADHSALRPGRAYYTTSSARPSRALVTEDRGQTWREVTGNLAVLAGDTDFLELIGDPRGTKTLIAATRVGVFRTDTATAPYPSWYRYMNGLPVVVQALNLEVSLLSSGQYAVRLGTYGQGYWERQISPTSYIFADGLEAGSTIAWSLTH